MGTFMLKVVGLLEWRRVNRRAGGVAVALLPGTATEVGHALPQGCP